MNFTELKYIVEYPRYAASPDGKIYSFNTNRFLKQSTKPSGYKQVSLSKHNIVKSIMVHRIIASLFCEKRPGCNQVNHKDGNKGNNHYKNLEWVTAKENNTHALETGLKKPGYIGPGEDNPSAKISEVIVEDIIKRKMAGARNIDIADFYDLNRNTINQILAGNTWKHVSKRLGYTPKMQRLSRSRE